MGGRQVRTGKEYGEIYDHHFVEYEYADGSTMFSQCRHIEQCYTSISEHVVGTKGYADISGGLISTGSLKSINAKNDEERIAAGDSVWRFPLPKGKNKRNAYQVEHNDLLAAIRAGTPYNEAEYGAMSTMTAILGRMCTYSGKMIRMDDALASEISLAPKEYSFAAFPRTLPDADGRYVIAVPGVTKTV
jgi:myo-inositol 2-dehydrogenase / D-chiro-inositol 1-dehydrogenase